MCYYGLGFASTSLSGNPYSNFFLSVLIEIPGYVFCILVMDCWGRRPILSFCQVWSVASCSVSPPNIPWIDSCSRYCPGWRASLAVCCRVPPTPRSRVYRYRAANSQ